jgi:predicted transglutaminase-like cysteine proteinase
LLESIALEETALSGILNELGNKLQKSIQLANNMDDLLEINKAVNKTITNVTQLEHILYAKLETISSLCNKKQ